MTQTQEVQAVQSLLADFAKANGLDATTMGTTLVHTIFPSGKKPTMSQVYALLLVAKKYSLDPWTKQIYAFPDKGGGIIPIISVDGWFHMMNENPSADGCQTEYVTDDKGRVIGCKATLWRKDRTHPITVTEFIDECSTGSGPWNKSPKRMIRHRAICQGIRVAFGISGVYTPDEAEEIRDAQYTVHTSASEASGSSVAAINEAIAQRAGSADKSQQEATQEPTIEVDEDGQRWEVFPDEFGEIVRVPINDEPEA